MKYNTLLYYCYSTIADAEQFAADHLIFCKSLDLTGRIIVATEGLNGTVSGTDEACKTYMDTLHADERFATIDFKVDEVDTPSFVKMHVRYRSGAAYKKHRVFFYKAFHQVFRPGKIVYKLWRMLKNIK